MSDESILEENSLDEGEDSNIEYVYSECEPEVKLEDIYSTHTDDENITVEINELRASSQSTPVALPTVPTLVFIVPYRDREAHYKIFSSTMKEVLLNVPPSQIFYINQRDSRGFNRGAMKNIGFLAVKNMYPNDYQNITLVFNDVDTMPSKEIVLNYVTTRGIIKHFYGFENTLGGIVSVNAGDFEKINGFPNFWAWGYEDNLLQQRAINAGIKIDRSVFYKIFDPCIIHLTDSPLRTVNRAEFDRYLQHTKEGIHSITDLQYTIRDDNTGFVDVLDFNTTTPEIVEKRSEYDLRNGPAPFKDLFMKRRIPFMRMHF